MAQEARYDFAGYSALYKRVFGPLWDNMWTTSPLDPFVSRITKVYDFPGDDMAMSVRLSLGGGVGGGGSVGNKLPEAYPSRFKKPLLTRRSLYGTVLLDLQSMLASKKKEGAFKESFKDESEAKVTNFIRHYCIHAYGKGDGAIGQFSGSATGTAAAPVITILTTGAIGFILANWEEDDMITVNADATLFRINEINESTRAITLERLTGSLDLTTIGAGTHTCYLQNTKDVAMYGMRSAIEYSGSYLGVSETRKWKSSDLDMAGAAITPEALIDQAIVYQRRTGMMPTDGILSFKQMASLLAVLTDRQENPQPMKINGGSSDVVVAFDAIKLSVPGGTIPLTMSRFLNDSHVVFANVNKVQGHFVDEARWREEDGSILGRVPGFDEYEARYSIYGNLFWNPLYLARMTNFAVP